MPTFTLPCAQIEKADVLRLKHDEEIPVEIKGEFELQSNAPIDWVGGGEDGIAFVTSVAPPRDGVTKVTICQKRTFHD